jgi:hypothetical protein
VVYLHVGSANAGTRRLRRLLDRHCETLRRSGVVYRGGSWDQLVEQVRSRPGTSVVSHDLLVNADAETAGRAVSSFGGAEVHVLVTAGALLWELFCSWQAEVENRLSTPWPDYAASALESSDPVDVMLARWRASLSADRVHLLTVPADDRGTVLWRRFCVVVGLDSGEVDATALDAGATLGYAGTELVRLANLAVGEQLSPPVYGRVVNRMLTERVLAPLPARQDVPASPQLLDLASGRSVETVKSIARAGYDVVGDLDELLVPVTPPAGGPATDRLTSSELLEVAVPAIVGCVRELKGLVPARAGAAGRERAGAAPPTAVGGADSPLAGSRQTVFVHIGLAKTGTTHLQSTMSRNREQLRSDGFLYPGGRFAGHFFAALDVMQTPFRSHKYEQTAGAWEATVRELLAWDGPALVSHEVLATASREAVQRIADSLPGVELHVVITARDLARQLPAVWQERLKVGHDLTWATFLSAVKDTDRDTTGDAEPADPDAGRIGRVFWRGHNLTEVAARWEAAVPADRIHVVTVPNVGADPALLWRRFAETLGLDPDRYVIPDRGANKSLGPAEAELLRRTNPGLMAALTWEDYERYAKWDLSERVLASREQSGRIVLPASEWDWAVQRCERTLGELRQRGYDVVGELDDLRPQRRPASPSDREPDQTDEREVAGVAVDAVAGLLTIHGRRVKPSPQAAAPVSRARLWTGRLRDWRGHPRRVRLVLGAVSGRVRRTGRARRARRDRRSEAGADVG